MTTLYVSEYAGFSPNNSVLGNEPATDQAPVSYAAGSASSAAFQNNTSLVRIHVDSIASIKFGTGTVTATTSNKRMAAGTTEYFIVPLGQSFKVAAITNT